MKKMLTVLALFVVLGAVQTTVQAMPVGTSPASKDYVVTAEDLHNWSGGFYLRGWERAIDEDGWSRWSGNMKMQQAMAFVGYDVAPWVTTYVTAGQTTLDAGNVNIADEDGVYGVGLRLNLLDHDILSPTLMEDRVLITSSWQYSMSKEFDEFFANLLLHVVNDLERDKFFVPYSIALYGGPVYSQISMDDYDYEVEDLFGMLFGVETHLDDNVGLHGGVEYFGEEIAFDAGLTLRF